MTKKTEGVAVPLPKEEVLREAANSSIWKDVIRPELVESLDTVRDILLTMSFESKFQAGEIFVGRRMAASYLQEVISRIDNAGVKKDKDEEDKKKDSFE